jgi:hypothetical protein
VDLVGGRAEPEDAQVAVAAVVPARSRYS